MELFHVLNRGVDQRSIVADDQDRIRFVHDLFEFNDIKPAGSTYYSFQYLDLRSPDIGEIGDKQKRQNIVEIHGWCLMDNHYHLLLSEKIEGGITLFIRKLNIGYAKYFNERYKRTGTLFQGRTKKKHIDNDAYFLHILNYIHLNPLDYLKESNSWREKQIRNHRQALSHLKDYRWSSYIDYCGTKNFPSIITTDLFQNIFRNYKKEIKSYLREIDTSEIQSMLLE